MSLKSITMKKEFILFEGKHFNGDKFVLKKSKLCQENKFVFVSFCESGNRTFELKKFEDTEKGLQEAQTHLKGLIFS